MKNLIKELFSLKNLKKAFMMAAFSNLDLRTSDYSILAHALRENNVIEKEIKKAA